MRAVILAGGKGTRLSPYTHIFPKPLMPIDGIPILHVVISQLKETAFSHVTLAVGYMADMIKIYFGEGEKFGVKIDYSKEETPLGTIGALSLIDGLPDHFLVMNGDILTDLDFAEFFAFHKQNAGCATIATFSKKVKIDYGIIESNHDNQIVGYKEKPTLSCQVSMGVYAFSSKVLGYIEKGDYLDFPDLIKLLVRKGEKVSHFPYDGYWRDIGCHDDYERATEDFVKMKERFLKKPASDDCQSPGTQ
jgi:NDP-sugar pyrophosphorylase family protein